MKKLLFVMLAALWALGADAQGVARMSEELPRQDPASGARIELRVADDAAEALHGADHRTARRKIVAYGVSLFRDNSQNARVNAYNTSEKFSEAQPGVSVEVKYESPWFRVEAGWFVDRTDAVALCGRILGAFPKAVVVQREVVVGEVMPR